MLASPDHISHQPCSVLLQVLSPGWNCENAFCLRGRSLWTDGMWSAVLVRPLGMSTNSMWPLESSPRGNVALNNMAKNLTTNQLVPILNLTTAMNLLAGHRFSFSLSLTTETWQHWPTSQGCCKEDKILYWKPPEPPCSRTVKRYQKMLRSITTNPCTW